MSTNLQEVLGEVRELLPAQGPLEFFVHHNTLHAFEHLDFKVALEKGQVAYGAQVYWPIEKYREIANNGGILDEYLEKRILSHFQDMAIEPAFLLRLVKELLYLPSNSSLSFTEIPEALELTNPRKKKIFYYELLKEEQDIDIDDSIRHFLLNFFAAYFDQGYAYWAMPDREKGPLACFVQYVDKLGVSYSPWMSHLKKLTASLENKPVQESLCSILNQLNLPKEDWQDYLFSVGYRYKGWVSLNNVLEDNPDWNRNPDFVKPSFVDIMTLILLTEAAFLQTMDFKSWTERVGKVTHFRYVVEYSPEFLSRVADLGKAQGMDQIVLAQVARRLRNIDREHILHCAYEDSFYDGFLKAFVDRQSSRLKKMGGERPSFQAVCCIDDREESFRRYMEELDPQCKTLGVAGHFGLDINYKGVFSAFDRPHCPNIIKPTKDYYEEVVDNQSLRSLIKTWGELAWLQANGSKILFRGWFFQYFMSILSFVPLAISIASPTLNARFKNYVRKKVRQKIKTRSLYLEGEVKRGMKFEDEVRYAEGLLRTMGLTENFASSIFMIGHGSHSLNNPHESAYNCGACGGGRGAPNGRLISLILNKPSVREELGRRGIEIPKETVFVGGYHNTASDEVLFIDVPDREDIQQAIKTIQQAGRYNSKERTRRFDEVSLEVTPDEAFDHVNGRSNDFAQARPEYNHATNALCIVGPREFTKDLFLDHRAFLVSYEPDQDDSGDVLKNIMTAVGPVCSGINLEYYFSCVDTEVLGCGSKLPHNVTGLLGVMAGYESDLLLGLSRQMIEIHEPLRLMLTIVAPKQRVENLFDRLESFHRLVTNHWMALSVFDPQLNKMFVFENGKIQEADIKTLDSPVYASNFSAFTGNRQTCEFGRIEVQHG